MEIIDGKAVYATPEEEAAFKTLLETEVSGLKGKNAELIGKLKTFDSLKGIDPNEYKTLKEQAAQAEEARALKAGEFDNLKKQLLEAHGKEKTAWDTERATLRQSLEENVLIATATQAIAAVKADTVPVSAVMPFVRKQTKLDDSGNPVVVDDSGNVRIGGDGKPLTISQLLEEMKADIPQYGWAFKPTGGSGADSRQSNGTGNTGQPETSVQRIAAGLRELNK